MIDLVYNHTITLECELKVVSKDAVDEATGFYVCQSSRHHFKTSSIGGNVVPNVKLMDSQREPKACDAILQAIGQRSQLISEVLDMINETWTKVQGEKFVPSHWADKES